MIAIFSAYIKSVQVISGDRKLLLLCLLPWGIGALIFAICYLGVWYFASDTLKGALGLMGSESVAAVLAAILVFVIASVSSLFLTLIANEFTTDAFAARFYEIIIRNAPIRRSTSSQISEGFLRLTIISILTITTFILGLIPLLQPVALLMSAFNVGYLLTDFMLCIANFSFAQRVHYALTRFIQVVMLGLFFLPTFAIPFLSILLLPVGYGAALIVMNEQPK